MTKNDQAPLTPAYTSRTLPAPWAECDSCGGPVPALAHPGDSSPLCASCARRDALREAAAASLAALLTPALGTWAHHWGAAGLSEADLLGELEDFTGAIMNSAYRQQRLKTLLSKAQAAHPVPSFKRAQPDRLSLDARSLPTITAAQMDSSAAPATAGEPDRRLSFTVQAADSTLRHGFSVSPGLDVLILTGLTPDGGALLLTLGIHGRTFSSVLPASSTESRAFKTSPAVLPQVLAALGHMGGTDGGEA